MYSPLSESTPRLNTPDQSTMPTNSGAKLPRTVLQNLAASPSHQIIAFPPNRYTLGGTAYLILEEVSILVDCPTWNDATEKFLRDRGGVQWLVLTSRDSIGQAKEIQTAFNCKIVIQEQEAYLLPGLALTQFEQEMHLTSDSRMIWTPGHSPGASCLYYSQFGGVLFSGRHLLPNPQGKLMPIQTAKTFHWLRQLRSVQRLLDEFSRDTLQYVCPGANTGFLRGNYLVDNAYQQLAVAYSDRNDS